MAYYLGIDAGGTSTRCVVGDERRVLGTATAGSSKTARVGPETARNVLQSVIRQACSAAGVNPRDVSHSCIGIAGASRPEVVQAVQTWARELLGGRVEVVGDMVVAFEAAFGGAAGMIVIAGTGSICFGRNEQGRTERAGGGGPERSDEGSAEWIGRTAVREALRVNEVVGATSVLVAAMKEWKLRNGSEIEARLKLNPAPDFSALFPAVQSAARDGDQNAHDTLRCAGQELAKLAGPVIRNLWPAPQRVPVAISGGVLQHSAIVRQTFVTKLRSDLAQTGHEIAVSFGLAEPVIGALTLARKAATNSGRGE
jgi:glucosamine kinase